MSNDGEREVIDLTGDDDIDDLIDLTGVDGIEEVWRLGENLAHVQQTIGRLEAARRAHDQQAWDAAVATFAPLPGNRFEDEIHVFEDGTIADWYSIRRRKVEADAARGRPFTPPPHDPFDDLEWDDDRYPIYPELAHLDREVVQQELEAMDEEDPFFQEVGMDDIRNMDVEEFLHLALQNAAEPAADPNAPQEQVTIDAGWRGRQDANGITNGVEVYHHETVATAGFNAANSRDQICDNLMQQMQDIVNPHLAPAPDGTRRVTKVNIIVEEYDADHGGQPLEQPSTYTWQKQRVTIQSDI
ncbi:hypothetical protein AC579_9108 [Pseudocercospora musae]|uniref:Uncharacterized protein n=1 Tax=Pseudocercospora musae TaxID=113226 RepID=A0A139IIH5_9PEZI|nr:hypothetical protein AC579_9108 [Pseudocercospora musae]